eukprot:symbB.v1.2.035068.t1/scaffold4646.1/size36968/3
MRGSVPLRRLVPFLRCSALPKSVAERNWIPRRWMAISVEEARRRERIANESAKARGAQSVSAQTVDSGFSVIVGLCIACWYFDWFSVQEITGVERLSRWLKTREIAVVVFELDDVMCSRHGASHGANQLGSPRSTCRRSRGDRGVSLFQLEDYFAGISQDFAEVAPALARRGYSLAVVVRGFSTGEAGEVKSSSSRWWRKEEAKQAKPEFVDGPELVRKLIARRCPDALPSFKVIMTTDDRSKADGSSKEYRVPARRLVLFSASKACEQDGLDKTWTGIHVPNPKEGFRHEDYALPRSLDEGYLTVTRAWLDQASNFIASKRP